MKNLCISSLFLLACGSGGTGFHPSTDLGNHDIGGNAGGDLAGVIPDFSTNPPPDFSMTEQPDMATAAMCSLPGTYGALGAKSGMAVTATDGSGNQTLTWQIDLDNQQLPTILTLQLYAGSGAFANSTTVKTGTFQIAGSELDYATCGVCVVAYTMYDAQSGSVADSYLATGGTVTLSSVAGNLTGSITNVAFQHVQIDPNTFESTPDPDRCMSAVKSVSFNDAIMM